VAVRVLSGRYELLEPVGRGGMGVVYRARDRELDRLVAVKVLPAELLRGEGFRARFRREARAAAGLAHPNIAVVHDIGEDDGGEEPVPYLVMELVEGVTLAELLEQGPLAPAEAGKVVAAVLEALEHSHGRQVVHRDIKPANIMVSFAEDRLRVKVMDFGIARLLSQTATRLTATGAVIGTPFYMSPEQAEGEPADESSDLYSVGCVLYELLTGRPPFTGDSAAAVLFQHLHKAPEPPSKVDPALDPFWDGVLGVALAKDPRDRYPDAAAMRRAVEAGLAAPPVSVPPPAPPPEPGRPTRLDTAPPVDTEPSRSPRPYPPGSRIRRRIFRRPGLSALLVAAVLVAAYGGLYVYKRSTEVVFRHSAWVTAMAFSPDGRTFATVGSHDATVWLWDVRTRKQIGEFPSDHTKDLTSLTFSPDGKLLVTGSWDDTLRLWDVATREQVGEPLKDEDRELTWDRGVRAVAFSPDGRTLASAHADGRVRLWDTATERRLGRPLPAHVEEDAQGANTVAFDPDGRLLASGGRDGMVRLWDVATREPAGRSVYLYDSEVESVAFSPDGEILAAGGREGRLLLWDVATREQIGRPLSGHDDIIWSVAFSPDGRLLASADGDNRLLLWDVAARRKIDEISGGGPLAAFSPDGTLLANTDSPGVRLWEVADRVPESLAPRT